MTKKLLTTALCSLLITIGGADLVQAASFQVTRTSVVTGLGNPRHMSFAPDGALYITEAGVGGTEVQGIFAPGVNANMDGGRSGRLLRLLPNGSTEVVLDNLPSFVVSGTNGSQGYGIHDLAFDAQGNGYMLIGGGVNVGFRNTVGALGEDLGYLFQIDVDTGKTTKLFDFTAYEDTNNPDGRDLISNIYGLAIQGDTIAVVDAGGNDILFWDKNTQKVEQLQVFPLRTAGASQFQAVPTTVDIGLDGAYYVSQLTGFPYPMGKAQVYRLAAPNTPANVYADGFTQVIDLDFDRHGNLYVLEVAQQPLPTQIPFGSLIKVAPDGTRTTLVAQGLIYPTGLEVTPDGSSIYVANRGFLGNNLGEIVRLDITSVPEARTLWGVLSFASVGLLYKKLNQM
jgi:sugar lactone lactonase YvrE